jgi:hypothetical protein
MTDWFVRSGAAGAGTGADWANAFTTLTAANTASAAGDRFWIADDHNESTAGNVTLASKGTPANPCFFYSVDHTVASPINTSLLAGAKINTTTASSITFTGYAYYWGVTFNASSSSTQGNITIFSGSTSSAVQFDTCALVLNNTNTSSTVNLGSGGTSLFKTILNNTTITFGSTSQKIVFANNNVLWRNTPNAIQGTIPTTLFNSSTHAGIIVCDGLDLSNAGSGKTLVGAPTAPPTAFTFINCKLGASVTVAATPVGQGGPTTDVINCASGATNYRQERYRYEGSLVQETTIVRSGGASDGTTALSHKIVSTANAKWVFPFESFPIAIWNDTVGSSVTATVEIVASGALNNDDVWLEVEYLGSASSPQASFATSTKANNLATGTALTASGATWASSPGSPQVLSVSFTPQQAGDIRCTVKVGKASQTVYVDPKVTLSPAPKIARHDRIVAPGVYLNAPVGASRLVGGLLAA